MLDRVAVAFDDIVRGCSGSQKHRFFSKGVTLLSWGKAKLHCISAETLRAWLMHANSPIERVANSEDFDERKGSSTVGAPLKEKK